MNPTLLVAVCGLLFVALCWGLAWFAWTGIRIRQQQRARGEAVARAVGGRLVRESQDPVVQGSRFRVDGIAEGRRWRIRWRPLSGREGYDLSVDEPELAAVLGRHPTEMRVEAQCALAGSARWRLRRGPRDTGGGDDDRVCHETDVPERTLEMLGDPVRRSLLIAVLEANPLTEVYLELGEGMVVWRSLVPDEEAIPTAKALLSRMLAVGQALEGGG